MVGSMLVEPGGPPAPAPAPVADDAGLPAWDDVCWEDLAGEPDPFDPALVVRRLASSAADSWTAVELAGIDPADLGPQDLPCYLRAWARAEAHAAARRLEAVRLVAGDPDPTEAIDVGPYDVAIALRVPLGSAIAQVRHARRLATHLPGTAAALAAGDLSYPHALRLLDATGELTDPGLTRAVEAAVLPRAPRQTPGELAGAAARAVAALDPEAFARRHREAAAASDVDVTPDRDAMAWLAARMPLLDAVVVKTAVDAYARARKADGDPRPLGVLRAEALRTFAEDYLRGPSGPPEDGSAGGPGAPTRHGRPVEVQLVAPLETWLGLSQTPAELPGYGPVPAETVRELTRDATFRRLITDPASGHLLDYGRRAYRPPADLAAFVLARHRSGAAPGTSVTQPVDLDHSVPWPEGGTSPANLSPQTRGWHRGKTLAGLQTSQSPDGTVTWRTPLGQTADVEPYDYRLGP